MDLPIPIFRNDKIYTKVDFDEPDGDVIAIELDGGTIDVELQVADHMAGGTLVIPRHKDLDWQKMGPGRTLVRKDRVGKVR